MPVVYDIRIIVMRAAHGRAPMSTYNWLKREVAGKLCANWYHPTKNQPNVDKRMYQGYLL